MNNSLVLDEKFQMLSTDETFEINGGGPIAAGLAIVGGAIVIFAVAFDVGYTLAQVFG